MKQVVRVLSTYSADLFGINSVLYELGGLVVMHDASGCNSTYNTHDEPRWYTHDSMIYISGLMERDAVIGNDEKLIRDICQVAEETHPKFISLSASMIPHFMGTDMRAIARIIEKRTGIPSFGFMTNSMDTYVAGGNMIYRALLDRFCPSDIAANSPAAPKRISVNLLGVTPLDFSVVGNVESLREFFTSNDIDINACMTMDCTMEEIALAGQATVNVVCSSMAMSGAALLYERFGTPFVIGLPIGEAQSQTLLSQIRKAAEKFEAPSESLATLNANKSRYSTDTRGKSGTFIIGEPVFASAIRECMECDMGYNDVHIICPTELDCELLRPGDVMTREEEDIELILQTADIVIADPIYRRILPQDHEELGISFVNMPHEAYSGRMYRSHIPVFIGSLLNDANQGMHIAEWLDTKIAEEEILTSNDIMDINEPFKK